ncbi:MAG: LTA synthase family protein [Elusimicrobiales bacterium]
MKFSTVAERLKIPFYFFLFFLFFSFILRVILWFAFSTGGSPVLFLKAILVGTVSDISGGLVFFFPIFAVFSLWGEKIREGPVKKILLAAFTFFYPFVQIFIFVTEYFFFEEFNSRFNAVAVDYLIYPTEVFVNIWQSYNVPLITLACLFFSQPFSIYIYRRIRRIDACKKPSAGVRMLGLGSYVFLTFVFCMISPFEGINFSDNRIINEIGKNGFNSFIYAAYSHNLDYYHFYQTIEPEKAHLLSRNLVGGEGAVFTDNPQIPIERIIKSKKNGERNVNVVIFIVESFGSEFWGVLGRKDTYTPYMDALSREGILFTNMYSTGNRTVRALEAILAGAPPLPAESLIKLKFSKTTKTIAEILKDKGYKTLFIYGGRGIFDNMKPFAIRYGFDRFIEQKDFKKPKFKTIWGVCDEDIYEKAFFEFSKMNERGERFFSVVLSVSNHKPYTYPAGTIKEDPLKKKRSHAVKYTDYALGKFFEKARKSPLYRNTLFVIIADHGARVYGSAEIPVKSYEIPMLFIGAGVKPGVNSTLGSSIDVSPTILDFMGIGYTSTFWGRSLFNGKINYRWVPLNHNRSVGFYDGSHMIVLGLNRTIYYYRVKSKSVIENVKEPDKKLSAVMEKAVSIFQTAWDIYQNGLN